MNSEIKYNVKTYLNIACKDKEDIIKIFNQKLAKIIIKKEKTNNANNWSTNKKFAQLGYLY